MDEIIPAKIPRDVVKYINDLSKELHIEDAEGVLGNELELIALVRNCPFLYNKHHTMFKDPRNRVKAWATIASIMRCSENDIKQRWRTLRESYTKTKKAIEHTSDPIVIARLQNWEYFEDMRFLDPYIKHRVKFKISDSQSSFFSANDESSDEISGPIENRLIQLIHENPLLYDKYTIGFSNASKKEAIWKYIASELGSTVLKCKTRWRTLRERFLKERRDGRRTWRYYDEMSFIEKFCKTRSKKPDSCNFQPNSNSTPLKHQSIKLEKIEFINTSSVGSDYESSSNPVCPSPCSNTSNSPRPEHSDPSVQMPSTTSSSQQQPEDEDTVFGQSIAAELRRITNRKKKLKLKSDIFRMICDVEMREESCLKATAHELVLLLESLLGLAPATRMEMTLLRTRMRGYKLDFKIRLRAIVRACFKQKPIRKQYLISWATWTNAHKQTWRHSVRSIQRQLTFTFVNIRTVTSRGPNSSTNPASKHALCKANT